MGRLRGAADSNKRESTRKVDIRLPAKGNANPHGARPVHLVVTMMKWFRTSALLIKNSLATGQKKRHRNLTSDPCQFAGRLEQIGSDSKSSQGSKSPQGDDPSGPREVFRFSPLSSAFTDAIQLCAVGTNGENNTPSSLTPA